jgi:hypothetical protein
MILYPWNMIQLLLLIFGLMALGVCPPLGMVLLGILFSIRLRFALRVRYWRQIEDARQAGKDHQDWVNAFRSIR